LSLRRDLDEARGRSHSATIEQSPTPGKTKGAESARQTYVVQRGDTLASISRKFYKTSTRWKQIFEANRNVIDNPKKLVAGQTLVIPARTSSH
jgi:nucleoid-associated protein YgaU